MAYRRRLYTASLVICIASLIVPACASADFGRCCMQSAREQLTTLQVLPWIACGINRTSQDEPNPFVNSTMAWCFQNCPGFQLSNFNQWSDLLTTFIVPAFAQLLLCPVGSGGEDEDEQEEGEEVDERRGEKEKVEVSQDKLSTTTSGAKEVSGQNSGSVKSVKDTTKKKRVRHTITYLVSEYINLLGDPASAISACFYQLWRDFIYVWQMTRKEPLGTFKEHVRGFAILAGQTTLQRTKGDLKKLDVIISEVDAMVSLVRGAILTTPKSLGEKATNTTPTTPKTLSEKPADTAVNTSTSQPAGSGEISPAPADKTTTSAQPPDVEKRATTPNSPGTKKLEDVQTAYDNSQLRHELESTIEMLLKAKTDFVNGIVIPVVLTFAGTAAGFYNAYTVLGDRDKGYSLAFGVFFAWLLVLSVVSNCYATTVNPTLLEGSLNSLLLFCSRAHPAPPRAAANFRLRVIPFRKRIPAFAMWNHWVKGMTADAPPPDSTPLPSFNVAFFAKFLALQTAGWLCVSVFTACAALIAYNTPTIGMGCRAFTFLLYTFLSLVLAVLLVVREAAAHVQAPAHPRALHVLCHTLRYLYAFLSLANALVLVGGTTFHLVGLFRSCRCQLLFGGKESLVVLSTGTALDVERARTYWISVGYVAFTVAWGFCAVAVAGREFISLHLTDRKSVV